MLNRWVLKTAPVPGAAVDGGSRHAMALPGSCVVGQGSGRRLAGQHLGTCSLATSRKDAPFGFAEGSLVPVTLPLISQPCGSSRGLPVRAFRARPPPARAEGRPGLGSASSTSLLGSPGPPRGKGSGTEPKGTRWERQRI